MKTHCNTLVIFAWNLLFSCLVVVIFFSCKTKNETTQIQERKTQMERQISFITYGIDPDAEKWYEYLDNGDLSRQSAFIDTIVFTYSNDQIIKRYLDKNATWQSKIKYITDVSGKIISSNIYDKADQEISRYKFEYNTDGYLIKTIQDVLTSGASYINEFVYESGNFKEVKAYDIYGKYSSKYAYEYYSDQPNVFNMNVHQMMDDIFPNERLGKMNKNMISQMANISKEGDTLSLLKFKYDSIQNDSTMTEYQSDVLNEMDTELIYHFKKK
jgi:hypothetical protein